MGIVGWLLFDRAVRLCREDARLAVHEPRFAEQVAREEFQIEAELSGKFRRNRPVKINRDDDMIAFAADSHLIVEIQIRVNQRVAAAEVLAVIGVREPGDNRIVFFGKDAFVLFREGLPLPRCLLKPDVAVGCDAAPVH